MTEQASTDANGYRFDDLRAGRSGWVTAAR